MLKPYLQKPFGRSMLSCFKFLALIALSLGATLSVAHATDLSTVGMIQSGILGQYVLGDLRHDHKLDYAIQVAADGASPAGTQIELQNGDGTFSPGQLLVSPTAEVSIFVFADVNGDGKLDLVGIHGHDTHEGTSATVVFLGNGDGTFKPTPIATQIAAALEDYSLAAGDFNGDGKQDIATYEISGRLSRDFTPTVLLSNGDGTFQAPIVYTQSYYEPSVMVADVNHTGKQNFIVEDGTQIVVLSETGNGQLANPRTIPIEPYGNYRSYPITITDLNHDHLLDFVVATNEGTINVYLNQGDGTFAPPAIYDVLAQSTVAGDVDRDGNTDIVALSGTTATVLKGSPNGVLSLPSAGGRFLYGYLSISSAYLADVYGDGKLDLVSAGPLNEYETSVTISIVRGVGNGTFVAPWQSDSEIASGGAIVNADVNNDGKRDLVVTQNFHYESPSEPTNTIRVLMGNGDGTFTPGASYTLTGDDQGSPITNIFAADVNKDGKVDLIFTEQGLGGYSVYVLFGNGDGTFQAPVGEVPTIPGIQTAAIGDFNHDGNVDLVIGTRTFVSGSSVGGVAIYTGDGTGAFTLKSSANVPGYVVGLTVADFNGDGNSDVASIETVYEGNASLSVLFGDGAGNLTLNASYAADKYPASLVSADFTGDKKPDIALSTGLGNGTVILIYKNNGSGGFVKSSSYVTRSGDLAVGDFNRDGKIDLVTTSYGLLATADLPTNPLGGQVSLLLGNGDGTFQTPLDYTTGAQPVSVVVGNFNKDAKLDIATLNEKYGDVTVLLNQPTIAARANATPRPVTSNTTQLSARGKYTAPNAESALTYTWSSTGPAPVTYSMNGSNASKDVMATFTASGNYTFHCTITDPTGGEVITTTNIDVTLP